MISQREIERQYNKMLSWEGCSDPVAENRVNCYTCTVCSHITKTIDRNHGVIPFAFTCEKCEQIAHSSFFTDIAPDQKPTVEWYRPTLKETIKLRGNAPLLNHVLQGGLEYRKIKDA